MCSNVIIFFDRHKFLEIIEYFTAFQIDRKEKNEVNEKDIHFSGVTIEAADHYLIVRYDTAFVPNINNVLEAARQLKTNCSYFFHATGINEMGTMNYRIDQDQFELVQLDQDQMIIVANGNRFTYEFQPDFYPTKDDVCKIIIEKIADFPNTKIRNNDKFNRNI